MVRLRRFQCPENVIQIAGAYNRTVRKAEKEKMLEYVLLSANELDDVIKNITDKTRATDYQMNF